MNVISKSNVIFAVVVALLVAQTAINGLSFIRLDFMSENFNDDDVAIFNNINKIMDNAKYIEFENLK